MGGKSRGVLEGYEIPFPALLSVSLSERTFAHMPGLWKSVECDCMFVRWRERSATLDSRRVRSRVCRVERPVQGERLTTRNSGAQMMTSIYAISYHRVSRYGMPICYAWLLFGNCFRTCLLSKCRRFIYISPFKRPHEFPKNMCIYIFGRSENDQAVRIQVDCC